MRSNSHPSPHLTDDQLMEAYVLASESGHLNVCDECRARYENLAGMLEQVRDDAVAEADAIFTAERLDDQRDRIVRRLERHGHPADVLLFPNRAGGELAGRRLLGPARRWIAGAAAAGLVAGLFLGFAVDRRVGGAATMRRLELPARIAVTEFQSAAAQASMLRDEQILTEIEEALTGPRKVLELRALDAMTTPPELQEVSLDLR